MRKAIIGGAFALLIAGPTLGTALADVSTNPTTRDAYGYCIANHIANFNGDNNGIGHARRENRGTVAQETGNRAPAECTTSQGAYAPISNNG